MAENKALVEKSADITETMERILHWTPNLGTAFYNRPDTWLQRLMDGALLFLHKHEEGKEMDWEDFYRAVGAAARAIITQDPTLNFKMGEFIRMLLLKHQQYGEKPIRRHGHAGLVLKIDTKVCRLLHLWEMDDRPIEAVNDTLIDLVGYSVLGLRYLATT